MLVIPVVVVILCVTHVVLKCMGRQELSFEAKGFGVEFKIVTMKDNPESESEQRMEDDIAR